MAVMKITGMSLVCASPRRRRNTSWPSMSGIITSSRISSGRGSLWAARSARSPELAARTW